VLNPWVAIADIVYPGMVSAVRAFAELSENSDWMNWLRQLSCIQTSQTDRRFTENFIRETFWSLRISLFWIVTRWGVAIPYRSFETTYRSCLQGPQDPYILVCFVAKAWNHAFRSVFTLIACWKSPSNQMPKETSKSPQYCFITLNRY